MDISEKKKIMIIDDEADILELLGKRLRDAGYDTLAASEGAAALKILEKENPDLIILDIMMPGMDGFEVCGRIKKFEDMSDIPIIFLTAKNSVEDKVKGLKAGVFDYITKPVDHRELLARIEALIRIRERYKTLFLRDELTGLCNYNFFKQEFAHYFESSKRYGRIFSIIVLDIDNFKGINDTYGHLCGNSILKKVGEELEKNLRKVDIIIRYGGDEFVAILPETTEEQAKLLLSRLKQEIGEIAHSWQGETIKVPLSFGSATFSKDFQTKEMFFEEADKGMYKDKSNKHIKK